MRYNSFFPLARVPRFFRSAAGVAAVLPRQVLHQTAGADADGNLQNDQTSNYQWDAEGRVVSIDSGSTQTSVYNAPGKRVQDHHHVEQATDSPLLD